MKKLHLLQRILKLTRANRLMTGFVCFTFATALVIWLREPEVQTFGDALWYCYAVITTVGFGDIIVHSPLVRILSVILSIYAVLVIAIITGVVVNFYNQIVNLRQKDTLAAVLDRLEHLPELTREELEQLSQQIRNRHLDLMDREKKTKPEK